MDGSKHHDPFWPDDAPLDDDGADEAALEDEQLEEAKATAAKKAEPRRPGMHAPRSTSASKRASGA